MMLKSRFGVLLLACVLTGFITTPQVLAQEEDEYWNSFKQSVNAQDGPATAKIGSYAEIKIPEGFTYLDTRGTCTFMEAIGNLTNGMELGCIVEDTEQWFIIFEWDDRGYVEDDERDSLDADEMLASMRESQTYANKERVKQGLSKLTIDGWQTPPFYDQETNNLVWALLCSSDGNSVVNYETRRLGRRGVMEITLVADPEQLITAIPELEEMMKSYQYTSGNRYSDFRKGDKVAKYGLGALIIGGAGAAALKSGLLGKLWKLIVVGVVAVGAFIKKIFGRGNQ